jgi:hypothetical protein
MKDNRRRLTLALGAIAGGLLAAAFLPMAVASADDYDFQPDPQSFEPTQIEGIPVLTNEVSGPESWNLADVTTGVIEYHDDLFHGTDLHTTIGSFSNDDFIASNGVGFGDSVEFDVEPYTQIDLADFGSGYANEWIDIPTGPDAGISDLLITPMGNFELFGTAFSDMAAALTSP